MIAFLEGRLEEAGSNRAVLNVGGVGYEIWISGRSTGRLPRVGETLRILTYQHVREDTLALYGFLSQKELDLFRLLLGVSGVGPKVALGILSGIDVEDFYLAVREEDHARLSTISGVGKKTAERLVVELKEKATLFVAAAGGALRSGRSRLDAKQGDVARALISLGYKQAQALAAVEKIAKAADSKKASVEELIKEALKIVGSA